MRTTTATGILAALLGMVGAIYPFGQVRDINVLTLGWNTSSPTIPREPIPPTAISPPLPLPNLLPLPYIKPPSRRQDGDRRADLPNVPAPGTPNHPHPGDSTQDANDDPPPDDATPISTQAPRITIGTSTRTKSGATAGEERSTAMAGLVIALGVAVALLA